MRKIPIKNYIILIILLISTVLITLILSNTYILKHKHTSEFYEYSNSITYESFDEYVIENPNIIMYMSDKYDLTHEYFENPFMAKIKDLELKDKLVFIDINEKSDNFLKNLKNNYNIDINLNNTPLVIVIIDSEVLDVIYINEKTNVEDFIDYEAFK